VKVHVRLIGRNLSCRSAAMSYWPGLVWSGLISWRAHHVIFIHCSNRVLSTMQQKRVK